MRLFFSYAQSDEPFRHQLAKHLSLLKREGILDTWDAYEITAGTDRAQAIETHLNTADIILLLISADFIASDRYDTEMQSAIARHERNEAQVIPILLKPCDWKSAPFGKLQPLPRGGTPITGWEDSEAALAEIAQEIRRVAIALNPALAKTPKSPLKPSAPFPGVRLPENFVLRAEAFDAVKQKLLADDDRALVVSAIAGLGGLGKSVLAAALVLDIEVQARFEDGILWVTLGQNPDLQNLLGDWIRTLDKSRESYSATTLEAASSYLQRLLIEKRMLLVVDDAWNGAHVEHFRVGGAECRVLVTTREAQIDGAEYHALDLMSEDEAIALVRQKLKRRWKVEQEAEVKAFAKSLGYLPLALDLAANQVRDGLSWGELRREFEDERKAVALDVLDSSEAWEHLDENQQRKYSLQACFQLSLRRLKPEQLRQFAWLGVLPEDVSLDGRMAVTLWNLPKLKAKKALIDLLNRSFLTSGTEALEGEPTYRVHDLMHDTARGVIEQDALGDSIQNLASAHGQLLERYRQKHDRWDRLPNDSYIHRHLTWHLQQAEREDEIHALMAMSDEQGRNAWFEACDRIGQPAIFVQDVKRGWAIAEQSYEENSTGSIVLQCRYALITATLNSLVENIPASLMSAAVQCGYWTPEQAWAYVEQLHGNLTCSQAIAALAPHLSLLLAEQAVNRAMTIQNSYCQRDAFSGLWFGLPEISKPSSLSSLVLDLQVNITASYFIFKEHPPLSLEEASEVIRMARAMENFGSRRNALYQASGRIPKELLKEALEVASLIQDETYHAKALLTIAQHQPDFISEVIRIISSMANEYDRVQILLEVAKTYTDGLFPRLLDIARAVRNVDRKAELFLEATKRNSVYFAEALKAAQSIQNEDRRASVLYTLAQIDTADFAQLLEAAQSIQNEDRRASVLLMLASAQIDTADFAQLLEAAQSIQSESRRASVLCILAQIDTADFAQLLEAAQSTQSESGRASVLSVLVQKLPEAFQPQAFDLIHTTIHNPTRAKDFSDDLPRLPLTTLSLSDWQSHLHLLAYSTRAALMKDIATLYPAIAHLGGKEAIRGMVDAMREVCNQWK
jgi:NB-ARC domain/TIR domain